MNPYVISFESMGTFWNISIWDHISKQKLFFLKNEIIKAATEFDLTYSRFQAKSLVRKIENKTGKIKVPSDFISMLLIYGKLFHDTNGKINPLIGQTISDLGYDASYSLKKNPVIRKTPNLTHAITIVDNIHIEKNESCLFDFGAVGKGYFVDVISLFIFNQGVQKFLVDGSGDIYYQGNESITAGLEHPNDSKKVIGKIQITTGALCASAINRRSWNNTTHIIDPTSNTQSSNIIATWVLSDSASISDGIATALFLTDPKNLLEDFTFDYLILYKNFKIKRSKGFNATLF